MVWYDIVQCCIIIQYTSERVQCSSGMVWYAWFGMVWFDMVCMVWYGMVWYGMVWYGMVWYTCYA